MEKYKKAFIKKVSEELEEKPSAIEKLIRVPEGQRGDISLPCFPFAKKLKKNPALIAIQVADCFKDDSLFSSVLAEGPYVNATIDNQNILNTLIPEIRKAGPSFATSKKGEGKTVVLDFSSPNIAKPLGFHHLRSTMIGNALANIHEACGYSVKKINFLGDWGKTFGLLAEIFKRQGDKELLEEGGISYLLKLYIQANELKQKDESFDEAAREMFKKQEEGDAEATSLWQLFRDISLKEFQRIYKRLNVSFDYYEGESFYRNKMDELIKMIDQTAGTRIDQGALVVDMVYKKEEAPMMLKKKDGATLYATRDIAAALDRYERFGFEKCLYVVGVEQKWHFDQLKRALNAMGKQWGENIHHVSFGRVHGMSTRKGTVVFLEDVLNEARDRAMEKMQKDSLDRDIDINKVSEQVGIGGIIFGDLKNLRTSDYTFDWDEILNTKGFTGICIQYAHARCCSILKKGGGAPQNEDADLSLLVAQEEVTLIKEIARLPEAVEAAAVEMEPSRLARSLYEIARSWNRYQQAGNQDRELRILCEDIKLQNARLALVDTVKIALRKGLELLGVPTPEAM